MLDFIKTLLKNRYPAILSLLGTGFILIGFFEGSNTGIPVYRNKILYGIVIIGVILILLGFYLYYLEFRESSLKKINVKEQINPKTFALVYMVLTRTQKSLVATVYRDMYRSEMTLDEFYILYQRRFGKEVKSMAELFYRLKDLENRGYFELRSLSEKTTVISRIENVYKMLVINKFIFS